jgi:hypothetical protein
LLRLWRISSRGEPPWRAALEDARTGERHGFADLARLCAFLKERMNDWHGRDVRPPECTAQE